MVGDVNKKRGTVMRYCSNCYTTLCKNEKSCPNLGCADARIEEFDFDLGGFIIPSAGLCREHPFSTVQADDLPLGFLNSSKEVSE